MRYSYIKVFLISGLFIIGMLYGEETEDRNLIMPQKDLIMPSKIYVVKEEWKNNKTWKLKQISERIDKAPYDKIRQEGVFIQSQRTIFHDSIFGTEIWKVTNSFAGARHYYAQIVPWNCNGSMLGINAKFPDQNTSSYILDADGTNLREFPIKKLDKSLEGVRFGYRVPCWDLERPEIMYGIRKLTSDDTKILKKLIPKDHKISEDELRQIPKDKFEEIVFSPLYTVNVKTLEVVQLGNVPKGYIDNLPFMYKGKQWIVIVCRPYSGRDYAFAMITVDGKEVRYLPRSAVGNGSRPDTTCSTYFADYPIESGGRIFNPDGGYAIIDPRELAEHPELATGLIEKSVAKLGGFSYRGRLTAGHYCYAYGGSSVIGVADPLPCVDYDPNKGFYQRRVILRAYNFSGHTSWNSRDKRWVFHSTAPSWDNPFGGMLIKVATDGSEIVHRIAFHNSAYAPYDLESHASISHDGTKLAFVSNSIGQGNNSSPCFFIAVVKHPDPPRSLQVVSTNNGIKLTWQYPPLCSVEIKGINIYRSLQSGINYEKINDEPIKGENFIDKTALSLTGKAVYYVATSVEHSSLESSRRSNEAGILVGGGDSDWPAGFVRVFVEAEDGKFEHPSRVERDATAVGDECAWLPFSNSHFTLPIALPLEDRYSLWIRHKNESDITLSIDSKEGNLIKDLSLKMSNAWIWSKLSGEKLTKNSFLKFLSNGDLKIDRILLTTDDKFVPSGKENVDEKPPSKITEVKASEVFSHWLKLSWKAPNDKDIRYFNIYCSKEPNFKTSQETLVWSPSKTEISFLDYGLLAGTTYYYRMTAVDYFGNESDSSDEISVMTSNENRFK